MHRPKHSYAAYKYREQKQFINQTTHQNNMNQKNNKRGYGELD